MKRLIFSLLVVSSLFLASCASTPINVATEDQKAKTTVEIQQRAAIDSTIYKAVVVSNSVYLVNPKTNLVEKQIDNDSGVTATLMLFVMLLLLLLFIAMIFAS